MISTAPWACALVTFLAWLAKLAFQQYRVQQADGRQQPRFLVFFHCARGAYAFLLRFTILVFLCVLFIDLTAMWQWYAYSVTSHSMPLNRALCCEHLHEQRAGPHQCFVLSATERMDMYYRSHAEVACALSNFSGSLEGSASERSMFQAMEQLKVDWSSPSALTRAAMDAAAASSREVHILPGREIKTRLAEEPRRLLPIFFVAMALVMIFAWCLSPLCPGFFVMVLSYTGPLLALCFAFVCVQWRIFAPLTNQLLIGLVRFDSQIWAGLVNGALVATFFGAPFAIRLRAVWHIFYRRTLRQNFFEAGKDVTLEDMQDNPWCPFMIFTGTVNDYKPFTRPMDRCTISEISMSSLHMGSTRTGYVDTPVSRTLSRCIALSGAGCLDAISLSMNDQTRYRFWLEMLNLSWGGYMLFEDKYSWAWIRWVESWLFKRLGVLSRISHEIRLSLRTLPVDSLLMFATFVLNIGFYLFKEDSRQTLVAAGDSRRGVSTASFRAGSTLFRVGKFFVLTAVMIFVALFALSFFGFTRCLDFIAYSRCLRQMHQATGFYYIGRPPSLLYVTDGGIQDCTAVLQLMQRRVERILLVLAAGDPEDELAVLRTTIRIAHEQKLGCFYDVEDPTRSVDILLDEFRERKSWTFFELGIRYGWTYDVAGSPNQRGPSSARLLVVKNRLPPDQDGALCRPPLTEEEILGCDVALAAKIGQAHDLDGFLEDALGGLGCCNWCHTCGCNCGRKFPHLTFTGYLWLTPALFGAICRLGHDVSKDCVEALTQRL